MIKDKQQETLRKQANEILKKDKWFKNKTKRFRAKLRQDKTLFPGFTKEKAKMFYSSSQWRKLRYDVLVERKSICECCGSTPPTKIVVDHIQSVREYWDLRLVKTNLQVLCEDCNLGKGSKDKTDWRKQ